MGAKHRAFHFVAIVFVSTVVVVGLVLSPTGVVQPQETPIRILLLPGHDWQWERVSLSIEPMVVEPMALHDTLMELVEAGDLPDVAELPPAYAEALALEAPDAIYDLPDEWMEYDFQPLVVNARVVGLKVGYNLVLVFMNPLRWEGDPEQLFGFFENIQVFTGPCISEVVTRPGYGAGQQQQQIQDQQQDLLLYHPEFQATFDVIYDREDPVLQEFDIRAAEYFEEGDSFWFVIELSGEQPGGLMREIPQAAQVGVFLDVDFDGASDYYAVTTSSEQGWLLTSTLEPVTEIATLSEGAQISLIVPTAHLVPEFDWTVVSGYSPDPDAYYVTPFLDLPIVPIVDIAYPQQEQRIVQIHQGQQQQQQQLAETIIFYCPVPGGNYGQYLLWQKVCPDRVIQLWCMGGSFGRFVVSGSGSGWIARCPYGGGQNYYSESPGGTAVPEELLHWVQSPSSGEQMNYRYVFSSNSDYIINDPGGRQCQPWPMQPQSHWMSVPGYCP